MTDVGRASGNIPPSRTSQSYDEDISNLVNSENPNAAIMQALAGMSQSDASAFLKRLKADGRLPKELLNNLQTSINSRFHTQPQQPSPASVRANREDASKLKAEAEYGGMLQQMQLQKNLAARSKGPTQQGDGVPTQADQTGNSELPVLAKKNPEFGKSWDRFHSKAPNSEGAGLPARMKLYGVTDEELRNYITTGKESPGLTRAIADSREKGGWPALGVTRAALQLRADYLRATSPKDGEAQKEAAALESTAESLTRNRSAIRVNWGTTTYSNLEKKYPDPATRPTNVQQQMDEARKAIESIGEESVQQIEAHPQRYRNNNVTGRLADDAPGAEAIIRSAEANAKKDLGTGSESRKPRF